MSSCVRFRDGVVAEAAGDYARLLKSLENLHFFANLAPDEEAPRASLNLGLAALIGTINEFSELVYQYSNPQILLYWWHSHRKRLHSSGSDSEKYCKCILQFLDESTLLETTSPLSSSHIHSSLCVFVFVLVFFCLRYGICVFDGSALVGELSFLFFFLNLNFGFVLVETMIVKVTEHLECEIGYGALIARVADWQEQGQATATPVQCSLTLNHAVFFSDRIVQVFSCTNRPVLDSL